MIEIKNYNKTFHLKGLEVEALRDVSLKIEDGEVYGVIGYSGAGKSTLVRCINFLEVPDSGSMEINGNKIDIKDGVLYRDGVRLSVRELNKMRKGIGMIFQHFNLLDRSTVFDNIAYPLKYQGLSKDEISKRVYEMLDLVSLREKVNAYPSQLSGGQKQRVAIARALVNNPKILLSDEATSALDPEATESILNLLAELNKKLGLTVIIITHEMSVIKTICSKVAVMEDGRVVEEGNVYDIFSSPNAPITKKFVSSTSSLSKVDKLIKANSAVVATKGNERLYKLTFKKDVDEPVISEISRRFNIDCSIVLANVEVIGNDALGAMIVKISGEEGNIESAVKYITDHNVLLEEVR